MGRESEKTEADSLAAEPVNGVGRSHDSWWLNQSTFRWNEVNFADKNHHFLRLQLSECSSGRNSDQQLRSNKRRSGSEAKPPQAQWKREKPS